MLINVLFALHCIGRLQLCSVVVWLELVWFADTMPRDLLTTLLMLSCNIFLTAVA